MEDGRHNFDPERQWQPPDLWQLQRERAQLQQLERQLRQ